MAYRALITGISGFVGGFLAEHLLDCGDRLLGCSFDGTWEEDSPRALSDRLELPAWDLAGDGGIRESTRLRIERFSPQVIYHLAAVSVPEQCGDEEPTELATAVNVGGTRQVLQLVDSLTPSPRLLLISSSHVYAPVDPQSPRVDENAPLGPRHGYGMTKLAAEEEVRHSVRQHGCDAVIVRAFQHTGPRQKPPLMLPQWASQFTAAGSDPVEVYTLDAQLDISDVRDMVRAYRLLVQRGRRGEVYNVGSGRSQSSGHILQLLSELADANRAIMETRAVMETRAIIETRPGHRQEPIANIDRLVRRTGWQAEIPIERTVADTFAWWQQKGNPETDIGD